MRNPASGVFIFYFGYRTTVMAFVLTSKYLPDGKNSRPTAHQNPLTTSAPIHSAKNHTERRLFACCFVPCGRH